MSRERRNIAFFEMKKSSAEDLAHYKQDGVVHLKGAFDKEWLSKMRSAFTEAMEKPGKHAEFVGKNTTWDTLFAKGTKEELQMFQDQLFYQEALTRAPGFADVIQGLP